MKEREVKAYFLKRAKEHGCLVRKVRWENRNCAFDWLLLYPAYLALAPRFVELKRPGGKPTFAQDIEHAALARHGAWITVASSLDEVDALFVGVCIL